MMYLKKTNLKSLTQQGLFMLKKELKNRIQLTEEKLADLEKLIKEVFESS